MRRCLGVLTAALCAIVASRAHASGQAPAPPESELAQTVARVSLISGGVSFSRGDDPDQWDPADVNVPMTIGDRVWTGNDGRIELQVHGGNLVRLPAGTDLQALNLTHEVKQFSLALGTASISVRRLTDNEVFEVDTPNAAITLERPGDYRLDVDADGNTRVQVRSGRAIASAGGGQVALAAGQEFDVAGIDAPRYDVAALPPPDAWDRWVAERNRRIAEARSYRYVTADIAGVEDLDQYGRWRQVPGYGWAWSPASVEAGWAPYRAGRWIWQDPWGWTWVAAEPWGWAPYHYGRWTYWGNAWYWVPVGPAVVSVSYAPALVAFVGGSGGYVGWFPLAPREPYYAWWRPHAAVPATRVTYVNRTYLTVVNQNVFVSGRSISRDVVRDRTLVRSVESAPVLRGPVPVIPTRASLRTTTSEATAPRPPAPVAARQVVTRASPPPAPPRFDAKVAVIREKGGAPVAPAEAARLSSRAPASAAPRSRPAASGPVTLAPREGAARPSSSPAAGRAATPALRREATPSAARAATPAPARHPSPAGREPRAPHPTPRPTPIPEHATGQRTMQPPPVHERKQPPERVNPESKFEPRSEPRPSPRSDTSRSAEPHGSRPTPRPRPTPTHSPKG